MQIKVIAVVVLLSLGSLASGQNSPLVVINNAECVGTDDLGRSLPDFGETGLPKSNRYVGLFYWQWHTGLRATHDFDMTEFLKVHPKCMDYNAYPPGGPNNPTYYWSQPLFGYYRSTDEWVMRKHLAMICAAGVDFLFLDDTNNAIYDPELKSLLSVSEELKEKGMAVPRLTFFLNSEPEWKIESLYKNWYKPGKHDDRWFRYQGKPLLMAAMPTDATKLKNPALLPEIQQFFTWRPTWALFDSSKEPQRWRFIAKPTDPPALGSDGKVEQMVVCKSMGGPIWDSFEAGGVSAVAGSKFTAKDYDNGWTLPDMAEGNFFDAGWKKAQQVAPPILLVTGWNEWTASIWETPGVIMLGRVTAKGQGHIVDEYNMQFNRDIEPMRGGYGDDYYWQFLINMRKYKGMCPPQKLSVHFTLSIDGPLTDWNKVTPVFRDSIGHTTNRDVDSNVKGIHYTDHSARNEFESAQVALDEANIYFRVHTTRPLSPSSDPNWMMLLIDSDQNPKTGWAGYDLLINAERHGKLVSVAKHQTDGWSWTSIGQAPAHWSGNDLLISLPRKFLQAGSLQLVKFDFKWIDNLPPTPKAEDFYTSGDTSPYGRLNYRFEER